MSAAEAFGSNVTVAKTIAVPRLTGKSFGELESTFRIRRRDVMKAVAKDLELSKDELFKQLASMEIRGVTIDDLYFFINTREGIETVFRLALAQENRQAELEAIMLSMVVDDRRDYARVVAGFMSEADLDAGKEEGQTENPPQA